MQTQSNEGLSPTFQTIIDYFPGGISMFNKELEMVACNQIFRELLAFPDEMFKNGLPPFRNLVLYNAQRGEYGPGDPEAQADVSCERARSMQPHVFERIRGEGQVLEVRGSPLPGGGFVSIYVDISDRKRAEAETLRTASYFQEVLANLPFGVLVLDKALNVVFWNAQVANLFDLTDGFIQKDISVKEILRATAKNGCYGPGNIDEHANARFEKLAQFQANSVELIRPNGGTLLVRSSPVMIAGEPAGLILLQEDITERKLDEQRSRENDMAKSLAVLRDAVGNISQGISMLDSDLNLVVCNARFLELLGFPDELGVPGTPFEAYMRYNAERGEYGTGDIEELIQSRIAQARKFEAHRFERERTDGCIIEIVGKPLPNGGFITTYTDITERKRHEIELQKFNTTLEVKIAERTEALQQALKDLGNVINNLEQTQDELVRSEKMAALGSMVAGVAHELNTPIGNSLMVASHLVETSKKMKESLKTGLKKSMLDEFLADTDSTGDVLVRNLGKAAELVSSFKQVAVDQTSSQRRSFKLAEMIGEVVTSLGPTIKATPYVVELDVAAGIQMESFPGPLGQVITNLINNGIIHGFDGRPSGKIRIAAEQAGNDEQVVLKITDNGKGIPTDVLPRIFDPFFTTRLGQGGSGLGLNIVHNIVFSVLGGRISADSTPGEGSCFTLVLPLIAPEQSKTEGTPPAKRDTKVTREPPTDYQSGDGI